MKLFERSGGHWMFWTGAIYLFVGLPVALYFKDIRTELIQLVWLIVLSMPFWCPPVGRWLNMDVEWDRSMFDLFKRNKSNVVNFPAPEVAKRMPAPEPEPKEQPAKTYYRLGLTDNNRVSFNMGYSEITMNAAGCQQMIDQLEFFKSQLRDEEDADSPGN